jgi:D-alanyl-D-alanine carboxypeptidase/D-alanyl-D-alanine-endopeptidase (penicillin-binding protein 4)
VVSPAVTLRAGIDSLVSASEFRNANWGILIVDPDRGDTLYSLHAGKLFMPASNMKVVTGSVALAQLGPEFRFRTTFAATGAVCGGTLHGDLVIDGRGDPTVSDAMRGDAMGPLRDMADSLRAHGIRRIAGRVTAGDDAFPGPTLGYGWSWDDLGASYSAGVDELFFNEGAARVIVSGARRPGGRVTASVLPTARYPSLHIAARTAYAPESLAVAAGSGGRRAVAATHADLALVLDTAAHTLSLTGWIAPGIVDTMDIVYPDQDTAYLSALRGALVERGVSVQNRAARLGTCRGAAAHASLDTLFVYQSLPLRDVLRAMAKPSQNQIAEILLRTIGLERAGSGTPDSGSAVVSRQLLAWGVQPDGYVLRDGSGLSRYDYLSPETLVHVLAAIRHDTAFSAFYDALPIAGVDGTIENRMRGTPAQGNVHAKTGFVANARSLSGYVTTADGHVLIFSTLCNNWTAPVRDVERVQDDIAVWLASIHLNGDGGR